MYIHRYMHVNIYIYIEIHVYHIYIHMYVYIHMYICIIKTDRPEILTKPCFRASGGQAQPRRAGERQEGSQGPGWPSKTPLEPRVPLRAPFKGDDIGPYEAYLGLSWRFFEFIEAGRA